MAGLLTLDDVNGRQIQALGSAKVNVNTATLSLATTLFVSNSAGITAGTKHTFVFAVGTDLGGVSLSGVLLRFGTSPACTDWGSGFDPSLHRLSGAVFYAPQNAPIYGNGVSFACVPSTTLTVAGLGLLTVTAYGWFW